MKSTVNLKDGIRIFENFIRDFVKNASLKSKKVFLWLYSKSGMKQDLLIKVYFLPLLSIVKIII